MPNPIDSYNTPLTTDEEKAFQQWVKEESRKQGRDLLLDLYDYDVRGYWKEGNQPDARGHGTDKFKKPNHPTFSDESIYHGKNGAQGGTWGDRVFMPGPTNYATQSPDGLAQYFEEVEPGVGLASFRRKVKKTPTGKYVVVSGPGERVLKEFSSEAAAKQWVASQ